MESHNGLFCCFVAMAAYMAVLNMLREVINAVINYTKTVAHNCNNGFRAYGTDHSTVLDRPNITAEFGVQSPQLRSGLVFHLRGLWTSNSRSQRDFCAKGWLKSNRPVNSLPNIQLSWPIELQRGMCHPSGVSASRMLAVPQALGTLQRSSHMRSISQRQLSHAQHLTKKAPIRGQGLMLWRGLSSSYEARDYD